MWKTIKLAHLGYVKTSVRDYQNKKKYFSTKSIQNDSFIQEGEYDFQSRPSRANRLVKEGDVLQARMMNTDKCIIINKDLDDSLFSTGFFQFRPPSNILSEYLFYIFKSKSFLDIKDSLCTGSTQKSLNDKMLLNINIPIPPLEEQKQIVKKLDVTFAEIDKNIENLKNKKKQVESLIDRVLEEELKNAEGENVKLGDACHIQPPKKEIKNQLGDSSKVSFIPMNSLRVNTMDAKTKDVRILSEVYKGYTYFRENDVLLAKITPCFENGKLGVARDLKNSVGFGSSEFIVFRCKEFLEAEYLYHFLNQKNFREKGKKNMFGSVGHKRVGKEFIKNTNIGIPSINKQKEIVKKLDAINLEKDISINTLNSQINNYIALKSSILSGELEGKMTA